MKILHISAADSSAGAGIASVKLHEALLSENVKSKILFLNDQSNEVPHNYIYQNTIARKIKRIFLTFVDRLIIKFYLRRKKEIFSPGLFGIDLSQEYEVQNADIIHLHWINHGFIDIKDLSKLNKPIVWTLHDCWVFTGGCHHFFSCENFKNNCGTCPVLKSENNNDLSNYVFRRKQKHLPMSNIKYVAISSWMKKQAKLGSLLRNELIELIPSGIDCSIYNYDSNSDIRTRFNLKKEDSIVLMGAQHIDSPYKGVQLSVDALNKYNKKLIVITFGNGEIILSNKLHKVISFGFVSDAKEMANLYKAADVFLCTSIVEGFGMTVAESQCSGTPAIAFEETGPSDIITHKSTGYLAKYKDTDDVVKGLSYCLNSKFDKKKISMEAEIKFSINNCAIKYNSIYKQILSVERKK
jgi:glycosyltransferase involved in cell wall biosynthesis